MLGRQPEEPGDGFCPGLSSPGPMRGNEKALQKSCGLRPPVSAARPCGRGRSGLTPVTLLDETLAVLEGLLPKPLLGRQQVAGGGGGRQHGQGGALQLRLVVWRKDEGTQWTRVQRTPRGCCGSHPRHRPNAQCHPAAACPSLDPQEVQAELLSLQRTELSEEAV